jgi:hypothetical protein
MGNLRLAVARIKMIINAMNQLINRSSASGIGARKSV